MKDKNFVWWFDPKIYPSDIVVSVTQAFVNKAYAMIDGDLNERIAVKMIPKDKSTSLDVLKRDFDLKLKNELQAVGIQISPDVVKEEVKEEPSYLDDPYKIAVPFEKRFVRKKSGKRKR
jgi:hypothetical protein